MTRDEQIREVIDVLTNGVGEKPYYRRNVKTNDVEVFVADDCLFCIVPTEEPDNDPERVAKAICEAGLMLKALLQEQPCDWIPVSERLPDGGTDTLALLESGNVVQVSAFDWNISSSGRCNIRAKHYSEQITHWMPIVLPEQPCKTEKKGGQNANLQ